MKAQQLLQPRREARHFVASASRPESGVRAPAAVSPKQRKPKAVENDSLKAADHAAELYTAWKQDALAGSPAQGKEREAQLH